MLLNIEKILLKCKWKVISILSSIRGQEFTNSFLLQLSAYIKVSTFKNQILDIPEPDFKGPLSDVGLVVQRYTEKPSVIRKTDRVTSCRDRKN